MKTILLTHPSAELYGADRTLLQLVEALDRDGSWKVIVALPRRGELAEHLEAAGATVEVGELGAAMRRDLSPINVPGLAERTARGARWIRRLIERHGVSLVHTNTSVLIGAALGAKRAGVPHLWHVHEILDRPQLVASLIRRTISEWADVAVANSEATADAMIDGKRTRREVVLNGIEFERFQGPFRAPNEVKLRHGIPADSRLILMPGRVNSWKGQSLLVEALGRQSALRDVHVLIAGDAPAGQQHFEKELDALIKEKELTSRVHRIPFTSELPELMAIADLTTVPSIKPEPFGLVAIESMAAGTPVVAARHGGLTEIVRDGATGRLFNPGDADSLAAVLAELFEDEEALLAMGPAARIRVKQKFAVERHVASIIDLYSDMLGVKSEAKASQTRAAA